MTQAAALPPDPLAAELGSVVGALERDLRLQQAAALAELRELRAEVERAVAALRDGPAGPQGEPGPQGPAAEDAVAPDDLVPLIGLAAAMLNESLPLAGHAPSPPVVVNAAPPPRRRTITTRRDADGNLSAEVVEHE